MRNKKDGHRFPIGFWSVMAAILTVIVCYIPASRMPYLLNMQKMWIYFSCTSPFVLAFFIYFIFFHKWKASGLTGFQMRYSNQNLVNVYTGSSSNKVKGYLFYITSFTIFSVILTWYSWSVVACGAYLYSKDPFKNTFTVISLRDVGNKGVDLGLVAADRGEYLLMQKGYYLTLRVPWEVGDYVCAKGRTSFLGTIVDNFSIGECS
jgi:hypothetical protein